MSTLAYTLKDSSTMLRRNLRHAQRYPSMTISTIAMPVLTLLLFNYAYGGALGAGIGDGAYIDYVAPGVILMAATSGAVATAVAVCTDMTEGIVNRFRTMSIARSAVLTGHVVGSMIQTFYLTATDMGLGGCAIGTGNIDLFAKMTGLEFHVEGPVGQFALGRGKKPLAAD